MRDLIRYYSRGGGRAQPGARDRQPHAQGGEGNSVEENQAGRSDGRKSGNLCSACAVTVFGEMEGEDQVGVGHRTGLDRSRRRNTDHRVGDAARQGPFPGHRQLRRVPDGLATPSRSKKDATTRGVVPHDPSSAARTLRRNDGRSSALRVATKRRWPCPHCACPDALSSGPEHVWDCDTAGAHHRSPTCHSSPSPSPVRS